MNAVRSPMAEGLMKHYFGNRVYVDSVGVRPADVDPFAVAVMDEIGIDISVSCVKAPSPECKPAECAFTMP